METEVKKKYSVRCIQEYNEWKLSMTLACTMMQWNKKGDLGLVEDGVLVDKLFTEDSSLSTSVRV